MDNIILRCDNNINGIFTAIYDAFVYKNQMQKENHEVYRDNISIEIGIGGNYSLFSKMIDIETDEIKVQKTILTIQKKLGFKIYETVFDALCHYSDNRATIVLGFLVRAFKVGQRIMEHMTDKYVMEVFELSRKVNKEADKIRGFIRFSDNGNYLLAHFEPKCDMIPVVMWHFVDRYPGENFVIYDDRRRYAVVHPRLKKSFYINESEFKQLERSVPVKTDSFEQLWKVYFEHTDIRERFNPQYQRNLCPKWYRKNMVEFT